MNKPHKHAAIIKAWADGADIQTHADGKWFDWDCGVSPTWSVDNQYRIKPAPLVARYRRYLRQRSKDAPPFVYTLNITSCTTHLECERTQGFIGWIDDDWIEHIIEQ